MEFESITDLSVDRLADVLRDNGLDEEVITAFEVAEIDGEQFVTLTRDEFSDMFKVLRKKRAVIAVWSNITGMEFDTEGKAVIQKKSLEHSFIASTPKAKRVCIESSSSDSNSGNPPSSNSYGTNNSSLDLELECSPLATQKIANSSPLTSQRDWCKRYKLPNKFSCAVEAALGVQHLTPNLRNEMVRDVCTSVLNYSTHPNKREREAIAQLIVEKYPFLKDVPINEDTKPWGSWEMKIQNRFKKLQRKRSASNTSCNDSIASPGGRPKKVSVSCWTVVPEETETDKDIVALMARIKKAWKHGKKDHGKITAMMTRTYVKRRHLAIVDVKSIVELVNMFPPLQNILYIKADFAMVMGNADLPKEVKSNFREIWMAKLLNYGKSLPKFSHLFEKMEQAIDSGCPEQECKERTALKLAESIFRPPNRKGMVKCSSGDEEAVMIVVNDEQSLDSIIKDQVQPVIMLVEDMYQSDVLYVVGEGTILCEIASRKIADGLVVLLATYYLYNVAHEKGKNVYAFLDMVLMSVLPNKCPVSVKTIIGILSNVHVNV